MRALISALFEIKLLNECRKMQKCVVYIWYMYQGVSVSFKESMVIF